MLVPVLALHLHEVSGLIVLVVGVVALALGAVGVRAWRRSGNRGLAFVSAAFLVFGAKGLAGSWAIYTRSVPHEHLEAALAAADLAIVLLLAAPLFLRRSTR